MFSFFALMSNYKTKTCQMTMTNIFSTGMNGRFHTLIGTEQGHITGEHKKLKR
jgi:hypothetical protein